MLIQGFLLFRELKMDSLPGLSSRNINHSLPIKIPEIRFKKGEVIKSRATSPKYSYTEILCNKDGNENGEKVA